MFNGESIHDGDTLNIYKIPYWKHFGSKVSLSSNVCITFRWKVLRFFDDVRFQQRIEHRARRFHRYDHGETRCYSEKCSQEFLLAVDIGYRYSIVRLTGKWKNRAVVIEIPGRVVFSRGSCGVSSGPHSVSIIKTSTKHIDRTIRPLTTGRVYVRASQRLRTRRAEPRNVKL